MAENKLGPNLQAGAGFLAKRVQKSLNRAQEKVLQKLGKTMETKDEQFEQCSHNLSKQQTDGNKLFKDVRAYHAAVKALHETSKRLSQTLRDIYEADWNGVADLSVITDSEDLLWNDYEEKLSDQIVRTMENYTSQFPEVKERVAKRGRKLVDYDSARHHLEALQGAKKKDEAKIIKAEEEFTKAQNVFEEINNELREEMPVLYQSRIGCYVTVFQNLSNLRDVFYKEMSVLNHELYNVMKKLETQHSGKPFIIKGVNSTKSKKRKSLVISNPIPCNTAFPAHHVSILSSTQTGKDLESSSTGLPTQNVSEETRLPEESGSDPSKDVTASDSDDLSSSTTNTPRRPSLCDDHSSDGSTGSYRPDQADAELLTNLEPGVPELEVLSQDESGPSISTDSPEQKNICDLPPEEVKPNPPPVPAPRVSFHSTDGHSLRPSEARHHEATAGSDFSCCDPPDFLNEGEAVESHAASEDGLSQLQQGDGSPAGTHEDVQLTAITEDLKQDPDKNLNQDPDQDLNQDLKQDLDQDLNQDLKQDPDQDLNQDLKEDLEKHSGTFTETLIQPVEQE